MVQSFDLKLYTFLIAEGKQSVMFMYSCAGEYYGKSKGGGGNCTKYCLPKVIYVLKVAYLEVPENSISHREGHFTSLKPKFGTTYPLSCMSL